MAATATCVYAARWPYEDIKAAGIDLKRVWGEDMYEEVEDLGWKIDTRPPFAAKYLFIEIPDTRVTAWSDTDAAGVLVQKESDAMIARMNRTIDRACEHLKMDVALAAKGERGWWMVATR